MRPSRRQAAQDAAGRISAQASEENNHPPSRAEPKPPQSATRRTLRRTLKSASSSPPPARPKRTHDDEVTTDRPAKRRKSTSTATKNTELHQTLFGQHGASPATSRLGPSRSHALTYHRPLLLDSEKGRVGRGSLLSWFDATSATRKMPWRKLWLDPAGASREVLERRAYEVWISEIMLQQTRVAVVIDYWNRWMEKWPTIHDLAATGVDEVVLAWRGLGYYSRARRIHEAARTVVGDPGLRGLLPDDPRELEAKVPGVGRYTAGAISSIVFGGAVPMVDGNVLRVLSRQLGIYGNVKSGKAVTDVMWAAADALVKAAAADREGDETVPGRERASDVPGRWGQALMELGSTLCTPKPDCEACPINDTCRAYNEGLDMARRPSKASGCGSRGELRDIEDACTLCEPFEDVSVDEGRTDAAKRGGKISGKPPTRTDLKRNGYKSPPTDDDVPDGNKPTPAELSVAVDHARRFPLKVIKKAVREEETLVCAVRGPCGRFLLHRRPEKGLLAGLWELPSHMLPATGASRPSSRKSAAVEHLDGLRRSGHAGMADATIRYVGDAGTIPWLFSHIKLTMHVHVFEASFSSGEVGDYGDASGGWRWAESEAVDGESMGTGMRKCWALAKEAVGGHSG